MNKKIYKFSAVLIITLANLLISSSIFGQTLEKMSYQAVIRNSSDALVTNTQIGMQISILQGSESGTAVYVETQTPITNANGLVSIEIGAGTTSDDFSTIDWANGSYFIKTETDPTGGTDYTITGTSQLLSVPYALHAKTAETVTGGIEETDPVFSNSEAANIDTDDIANLANLSGVNTGDQDLSALATKTALGDSIAQVRSEIPAAADGSETNVTAGTNVTVTGSGTTASPYVINANSSSAAHHVGELFGGGVVFWVDHTGQHGLIVSLIDLSTSHVWSNTSTLIGANAQSDWDGNTNTTAIIGQSGHTHSAAKLCADYVNTDYGTGTYSDWYLPSRSELNELWNNLYEVQKALESDENGSTTSIAKQYYWSSTEEDFIYAWSFAFDGGFTDISGRNDTYYVRAIRAF